MTDIWAKAVRNAVDELYKIVLDLAMHTSKYPQPAMDQAAEFRAGALKALDLALAEAKKK